MPITWLVIGYSPTLLTTPIRQQQHCHFATLPLLLKPLTAAAAAAAEVAAAERASYKGLLYLLLKLFEQ